MRNERTEKLCKGNQLVLQKYDFTKVQLIEDGYKTLLDDAAENDLSLSKMLKAIHSQESKKAAREKAKAVACKLKGMKLKETAKR